MNDESAVKPGNSHRRRSLVILAFLVCMAAIYLMFGFGRNDAPPEPAQAVPQGSGPTADGRITKALSRGAVAGFLVKSVRQAVPVITFQDENGKTRSLAEWRGRVVLLNLWATWCGPCREEMPELARLQNELGSLDFEVVALSLDRRGAEVAGAFLTEIGATTLKLYLDPTGKALHELSAIGLPATILIDRQGSEIGRLLGPARWASPEAITLVKAALLEPRQAG
ncbi:MAG: TlpA family protein disulfide reductase [Pseudomonadota bacterium]|nr:TlpA family protein disulfide reductase [Pseudomonadota bacterium]